MGCRPKYLIRITSDVQIQTDRGKASPTKLKDLASSPAPSDVGVFI